MEVASPFSASSSGIFFYTYESTVLPNLSLEIFAIHGMGVCLDAPLHIAFSTLHSVMYEMFDIGISELLLPALTRGTYVGPCATFKLLLYFCVTLISGQFLILVVHSRRMCHTWNRSTLDGLA